MRYTKIIYYGFLGISLLSTCQPQTSDKPPIEQLIVKTCDYLWKAQKANGSWGSSVHGLVKSGQAYTPYIIYYLLQVPDSIYPKPPAKKAKAFAFIREQVNEEGILGLANPMVLEYPNYATAYAMMALWQNGEPKDKDLIEKMCSYLVEQQWDESRGLKPEHYAYGGWGFGETLADSNNVGHVDISVSRRVLQALRLVKYEEKQVYEEAQRFLALLQKHPKDGRIQPFAQAPDEVKKLPYNGGFYYSPIVLGANKAKQSPGNEQFSAAYRSYATATADGVLALLASGWQKGDEEVEKAKEWLLAHPDLNFPEGIAQEDPEQWHRVLVLYHLAVRAEAYWALDLENNWQETFVDVLLQKQSEDGSFSNPEGARNKENDPLLGSTLALTALIHCL